jgi:hypothetical protein|tara:strand:- start:3106 stop:6078 length:2973 start_codon:yes stop_codon:yes gene_type:complete
MFIESPEAPEPDPQSTDGEVVELAQAATPGAESIGQIAAFQGTVTITRTDGTKVPAADGTPIFQGDLVETGADGAIGITFADDSTFSLAEAGSLVIDEMVYDPGTQQGKSALNVATGVFTFVSGQIAKTGVDAMVIKTPVALIGIRGTEGGGRAGPEGTPNTYSLFGGEMSVSTLGGGPPVVMNLPGQTTQMTSAYVPPTRPVTLPPAALQKFYAKAAVVAPKAVFSQQAGPATDAPAEGGPTEGGPTEGGPTDTPADTAEAAAAQAFEQALAAGDLDAAMAAAIDGAAVAEIEAVLTDNPEAFGSEHSGESVMDRMVDNFLIGVTGQIDHMGAGDGRGAGNTRFTDNFFEDGVGHAIGGDLDDLEGGFGFFDGFMDGHGPEEGEEDFFDFSFEDFLIDVFTPFEFEHGVLGFDENPFFLDEDDTAFVTASAFSDFVTNFTTGADSRSGGTGNTRFTMVQGSTLGGVDTIDGGAGTDELAFESLSGMAIIFDAAANGGKGVCSYSNTDGSITGTVTMDSIEQIYVDDGAEARVRFPIELAHGTGFGYILVGTASADTGSTELTVANGTNLSATYADLNEYSYTGGGSLGYTVAVDNSGDLYDAADRIFGSIIFGNAGDDTIIGTASSDILYGGAGVDSITIGKSGEDGDTVFGGDGADTIIMNESGTLTGPINGGTAAGSDDSTGATIGENADTIRLSKASSTYDITDVIIQGVEALDFTATGVTLTATNTFFQSLQTIQSAGTTTLKGQGGLNLSGVTNSDADVTTLGLDTSNSVNGSIRDFNDTTGRTITGTTGQNTIFGFGGGDTIDLGSDTVQDTIVFASKSDTAAAAGGDANFDVISNFDRADGDRIIFTQDGNLADFNDVSNTGDSVYVFSTVAAGNANLTTAEVVFISSTVDTADLTTANFADVIAAIGAVTAGTATDADAENDAIFVVTDGTGKSGIYLYTNQDDAGAGNTTVEADELTLLATFDDVLQDGDLSTVDTVNSV